MALLHHSPHGKSSMAKRVESFTGFKVIDKRMTYDGPASIAKLKADPDYVNYAYVVRADLEFAEKSHQARMLFSKVLPPGNKRFECIPSISVDHMSYFVTFHANKAAFKRHELEQAVECAEVLAKTELYLPSVRYISFDKDDYIFMVPIGESPAELRQALHLKREDTRLLEETPSSDLHAFRINKKLLNEKLGIEPPSVQGASRA